MPDTIMERERHSPLVLVDTANLTREEWLDWRRRGIGGSDVSAIIGILPFRTARDTYYDKLGIAAVEENEGNWVAMEMGHLLEDLVAKIFERKTGLKIYQIKKMFQHPLYPFMLADVDYFITMPDGREAILEIKTTNYNAKDHWWKQGKETVPVYYEAVIGKEDAGRGKEHANHPGASDLYHIDPHFFDFTGAIEGRGFQDRHRYSLR